MEFQDCNDSEDNLGFHDCNDFEDGSDDEGDPRDLQESSDEEEPEALENNEESSDEDDSDGKDFEFEEFDYEPEGGFNIFQEHKGQNNENQEVSRPGPVSALICVQRGPCVLVAMFAAAGHL